MEEKNQLLDYTHFNPKKALIFDVDLTILEAHNRDYENAEPIQLMIDKINELKKKGYTIILFTARGQLSKNGDMNRIEKENRPVLENWLHRHQVNYDYLLFCKPYGAYYIDDKSLRPDEFLAKDFE
jgi:capsule biosynthesis phosphatase